MVKYEYKVINTGFASLEDTIHAHAADGWRVVACPNYSNILKLILEREVVTPVAHPDQLILKIDGENYA